MCGRFTLTTPAELLAAVFGLGEVPSGLVPRYNIAPTQPVCVLANRAERRLEAFRWGLVPHWAPDPSMGNRMINARAETVAEKPAFRDAFQRRRCLVLADGFYEWKAEGKLKQPYYVRLRSGQPFAFAGLWAVWRSPDGEPLHSCTIITTGSSALLATIHLRMPVILPADTHDTWLDPAPRPPGDLAGLLVPYPDAELEAYPVSRLINAPANDEPACIEPLAPDEGGP